jgi:hypothetical protein
MSRRGSRRGPRSFGEMLVNICVLLLMTFLVIGPFAIGGAAAGVFLAPDNSAFWSRVTIQLLFAWVTILFLLILLDRVSND